jgi:hypothetical protein
MTEHRDPRGNVFKTFEIDANDCELYPGDRISPGFEIGIDIHSGSMIYPDFEGTVATVYYNPMNHSYLVMIACRNENIIDNFTGREDNPQLASVA